MSKTSGLVPSGREPDLWHDEALADLNEQEKLFVCHYVAIGTPTYCNAAASAEAAGYEAATARQQGYRVRHRPRVTAAIDAVLSRYVMPPSEALLQMQDIMRGGINAIANVVRTDGGGHAVELNLEEAILQGKGHVIRSVDVVTEEIEGEHGTIKRTTRKIRFESPIQAHRLYWKLWEKLGEDKVRRPGRQTGPGHRARFLDEMNEIIMGAAGEA